MNNAEEVDLLKQNPGALLVEYQGIIRAIVCNHIACGYIRKDELDETIQYVNEGFLSRLNKIRKQYNGYSLLRTYCITIFRNLLQERIRENQRRKKVLLLEEMDEKAVYLASPADNVIFEEEMERFDKVLKLFNRQRPKLELYLKLYFRIPVTEQDFKSYNPDIAGAIIHEVTKALSSNSDLNDKEVYMMISRLTTIDGERFQTEEAVRKWIRNRLDEIIFLLNGRKNKRAYDRETLQILAEMYYSRG